METQMDKITTEMAEHICDSLCRYPITIRSEEMLYDVCCECHLGKYICDILNEYNRLNDFDNSQNKKLLIKIAELEKQIRKE